MFGINSGDDWLLRSLFQYARKQREEGVYGMTEIVRGYLTDYLNFGIVMNGRNNLVKKLR